MKDIKTYLVIGLAVVIVLMLLFDKDPEPNREAEEQLKVALAIADLKIDSLSKSRTKLARKIAEDSILQAEERHTFQNAIGSLQTRLRQRRDKIDTLILESPALRDYAATADSVIAIQSARIDSLESDKAELRVDVREITSNFEAQLEAMRSKLKATEEIAGVYKSQVRKEKRKVKVWKVATVVGIVGSLWIGSQ